MKKLIVLLLLTLSSNAQSITPSLGFKAVEFDVTFEKNLIYGAGISITESKLVSKRANKNDGAHNVHTSNTKIVPSLFLLIGGEVEDITIIGKLGCAYYEQSINKITESQKFYRSVGVSVGFKQIFISYDSSNSILLGYNFKLKNN